MTGIHSRDLQRHLESHYNYKIVGMVDLDWLCHQPRNALFVLFKQWHKPAFESKERIVIYSRNPVSIDMLKHIQKCGSMIDISNYFILFCNADIDHEQLEQLRIKYSVDDCVFSTLSIDFIDTVPEPSNSTPLELPETFCFAPWAHLEISTQGKFRPCCVFQESIKGPDNIAFNINTDSLQTVYHSDYLKQLRQQFLKGQKPQECSACWFKEQHGGKSNRLWLQDHLGVAAQCIDIEQDSEKNLISLDIKLGNLCNFKCRICGPNDSSRIAEEQVQHFNAPTTLRQLSQKGQWVENPKIWQMLETIGSQLVNIDFYGGEPFLIKQQENFLNFLVDHNFASKIRLHYNSNGSIYPEHLFEKWKYFRQVDIAFSIDDIGPRFELERGGSWNEVEKNLDDFLNNKLPNMVLSIFPTINVQNVYYINELVEWFETKNFNALVFNILRNPKFLSITEMNNELAEITVNKLEAMPLDSLKKYQVLSIIQLIKQKKNSSVSLDQLTDYMLKLDKVRNQKFYETHSEVANIIYKGKNHGQTI